MDDYIWGKHVPYSPQMGGNRQFQAKTPKYNKKLSYRKETVQLHDITSSSDVTEKKHRRVGQFWVGL